MQLAWIGLGNMGRGMARNIILKSNIPEEPPLLIFNRSPQRAHAFKSSLGEAYASAVVVAESIGHAVSFADIVFTSLGNDASVLEIYEALSKACDVSGKLFVETSTVLPETTESVAKLIRNAGAELVAAPVFGSPAMADSGSLVVVLAGPGAAIDKVKPYCDGVISRATIELRDEPVGKASLLKVTGNTFVLSMVETLAEGHVFAEKSGLGTQNLHKFLETMIPPYAFYSNRMLSGDYIRDEPLFAVDLAIKDANHGINLAKSYGVDMKITKIGEKHLRQLKDEAGPTGDLPGIYGVVRKESGLSFSNKE